MAAPYKSKGGTATRPIYRDPIGTVAKPKAATTLEQKVQLLQKPWARPDSTALAVSNPLGNGLAGYRARGAVSLRGSGFAPRATSGMRTAS